MKNLITALAILLSTSAVAQPDKDWWACQGVASGGLKWEDGSWVPAGFKLTPPFVLMSDGDGLLTKESVGKVLNTDVHDLDCRKDDVVRSRISCSNTMGRMLYFNTKRAKGGWSTVFGTTNTGDSRDTVTVDAFECTKG